MVAITEKESEFALGKTFQRISYPAIPCIGVTRRIGKIGIKIHNAGGRGFGAAYIAGHNIKGGPASLINKINLALLKQNIQNIPNALEKVRQLRGVNFEFKSKENFPAGKQMGFIAQEAQKVIPEVVVEGDGMYGMSYAPITALLVEAVKEQQKIIEQLQSEIDELKTSINE